MKMSNVVNAILIFVIGLSLVVTSFLVLNGKLPSSAVSEGITGLFAAFLCFGSAALIFVYEKGEK